MKRKLFFISAFLSLVAFIISGYLLWQRITPLPTPSEFSQPQSASESATLRIKIPSQNIDVPVYQAQIRGTKWDYSTKGISHLESTPWAGQPGNAVYYGHNWPNILGKLHLVKTGDLLVVNTSSGSETVFVIDSISEVNPDKIEVIAPSSDSRLTLFTCIGFLDSKRLVVIAKPSI